MSNPTPSQTGKLLIRGSIVILSIVAVFIAVVAYLTARENTEFLEKGIRKKASILNKTENITRRTKRANKSEYFFKVAIFDSVSS